jgi:hypothetical protein
MNKANAELLQWHMRERKKDVVLCHPANGIQRRNFDPKHKDFNTEVRNIRFVLSTDGTNPFGRQATHIAHGLPLYVSITYHPSFV